VRAARGCPILTELSEILPRELNPARRRQHHPKVCQKVGLTGELDHIEGRAAPAFILHDALECFKEQSRAALPPRCQPRALGSPLWQHWSG